MARGSHRVKTRGVSNSITANSLRFVLSSVLNPLTIQPRELLRLYEDRRTWSPEKPSARVPRSFSRPTQLRGTSDTRSSHSAKFPPSAQAFKNRDEVLMCVRRRVRKEVLHALKKTGRGGQKSPRWNAWSQVHC